MTCPRPLLAQTYNPKRFTTPCYVQPKLNGIRAIYLNGRFYSRDLIEWQPEVVSHLTAALTHVPKDVALDGELYVHGWLLQRINAAIAVKRIKPTAETHLVEFHVFDLVDHHLGYAERWSQAWDYVHACDSKSIQIVDLWLVNNQIEIEGLFAHFCNQDYEGAMVRVGTAGYPTPGNGADKDNRSYQLLKRKGWLDGQYKCIDVIEGEGKHQGKLGALVLDCNNAVTNFEAFQVGTGFSDSERELYWNNPEMVLDQYIKIKYRFLSADGIPNHTSFEEIL